MPYEVLNVTNMASSRQAWRVSTGGRVGYTPCDGVMDRLRHYQRGKVTSAAKDCNLGGGHVRRVSIPSARPRDLLCNGVE